MVRKLAVVVLALCIFTFAQQKPTEKKGDDKMPAGQAKMHQAEHIRRPAFDKTLPAQELKAWSTLDPKNAAKFYVQEPGHAFFDVAPLKYDDWQQYEQGAKDILSSYKSGAITLKDDLKIHDHGDSFVWCTATLDFDMVKKDDTHDKMTLRWTTIWVYMDGAWKIAHEHVSAPLQM